MKVSKIIGWTSGILIVGYLLFVTTMIVSPSIKNFLNQTEFNSDKWKNWQESEKELTLRWDMVSDLTSDHNLIGMTVQEVEILLGEPDRLSKDSYSYYLGLLGIDTGTLFLTIENGVVTDYNIHRG